MKVSIFVLGLVTLAYSVPQKRKLFHEHFDDFMDVIIDETGDDLRQLMEEYQQYEEFMVSIDYMKTNNFKDLVYEMESLPEFKAVVDFLENDNIDIIYFIDMLNELIEGFNSKSGRQLATGKDMSSYINDSINVFPKDKLAALFDKKISEDEIFRVAMENLQSEEWKQIFGGLWESETFKKERDTLSQNGIHANMLVDEIMAIFGQN